MATVYRHLRNDTGSPFYVGIGKTNKRAYSKYDRSDYWKHIVKKHGYAVDIIYEDISWEEACKVEQYLIGLYGRKDLGKGGLVNLTDGGEGILGLKHTKKTCTKISAAKTGKELSEKHKANLRKPKALRTAEHNSKISAAKTGKKQSEEHVAKRIAMRKGKKQSEEHVAKRSASMKVVWAKKRIENAR